MKKTQYQKCYSLAVYYLAKRDYSVQELTGKLKKKDYASLEIEKVINSLLKSKILDDFNFSFNRIRHRMKNCGWGERRVRTELREKGVSADIIEKTFEKQIEEGLINTEEVYLQVLDIISRRYKNKVNLQGRKLERKDYAKIVNFALRRGFSYSDIKKAIDIFVEELNG